MPQSKYFLGDWNAVADREFVVARAFPIAGEVQIPGTPFEKEGVEPRRLRLLYESRYIVPVDSDSPGLGGTVEREDGDKARDVAPASSERVLEAITGDSEKEVAERYEDETTDSEPPVVNSATEPELRDEAEAAPTSEKPKRVAEIKEGKAGWFHVEDEDGEKIGKSTRDEAEAEEIKRAYEAGEVLPD